MLARTDKLWHTVTNTGRHTDDGRIEIGDARSGNAGGVAEFQRLAVINLIFHAGLWHPVVEVLVESSSRTIRIATLQITILVAQTCTCRPLILIIDVVGVGCSYLRAMVKCCTGRWYCGIVILLMIIATIPTVYVFYSHFQFMPFPQRTDIVCLESVLGKMFTGASNQTCIIERCVLHISVGILLLRVLARQGEHVRESEQLALSTRPVFVVQTTIPRIMVVTG